MKRPSHTAISILLAVTLALMGVPTSAFAAVSGAAGDITGATQEQGVTLSNTNTNTNTDNAANANADTAADAGAEANAASATLAYDGATAIDVDEDGEISGYFDISTEPDRRAEYHYKDSYFEKSSYSFDWSLCAMSNCLALSAFGASTGHTDADYANADANVQDLLTQLGFTDYACTAEFHKVPTSESIGAAIARKDIVDESGQPRTVIAVAIRGGNYEAEWSGNTILGESGEAEGFSIARDKVAQLIDTYLEENGGKIYQQPKIWIVGYSRASAVGNLTANFLNYCMESYQNDTTCSTDLATSVSGKLKALGATQADLYSYGFEVPAGGSDSSVYHCANEYKNMWNMVNPTDLVPMVAPAAWGFKRYGTDVDPTAGISDEQLTTQLAAISQSALNDWNNQLMQKDNGFRLYYGNTLTFIKALATKHDVSPLQYTSFDKSYMATYLQKLVEFTADNLANRKVYTEKYQDVFSATAQVMFAGGDIKKLSSVAIDSLADNITLSTIAKPGALYIAKGLFTLGRSLIETESLRETIEPTATKLVNGIIKAWGDNAETKAMLGEDGLQALNGSGATLVNLALAFLTENSTYGGIESCIALLPTAVYYQGDLMYGHDSNLNFAYVRAQDQANYGTVSSQGAYRLDVASSEEGGSPDNCTVTINSGRGVIATLSDGELSTTAVSNGTVKYSKNIDGSISLYVMKDDYSNDVTFELATDSAQAQNVCLKYYDYTSNGKKGYACKQYDDAWTQQAIPITNKTSLILHCSATANQTYLEKWVDLDFTFVEYDETAKGHYRVLDKDAFVAEVTEADYDENKKAVDQQSAQLSSGGVFNVRAAYSSWEKEVNYEYKDGNSGTLSVKTRSGNYTPISAFSPVLDSNGSPTVDASGAYSRSATYESIGEGLTWNTTPNLDTVNQTIYVVCKSNAVAMNKVTATGWDWHYHTTLADVAFDITAAGAISADYIPEGTVVTVAFRGTNGKSYIVDQVNKSTAWWFEGIDEANVTYLDDRSKVQFAMPGNAVSVNVRLMEDTSSSSGDDAQVSSLANAADSGEGVLLKTQSARVYGVAQLDDIAVARLNSEVQTNALSVAESDQPATLTSTTPARDTSLTLSAAQETYELDYSGCTATDAVGNAVASGADVNYDTDLMLVAGDAPEGQEFDTWRVEARDSGKAVRYASYRNAAGANVLVFPMPSSDVTVTSVYKDVAVKQSIKTADVKVLQGVFADDVLTEGYTLPSEVSCSGEGISSKVSLTWYDANGDEATTAEEDKLYKAQVSLNAEPGYRFDEDFAATIDGNQAVVSNLGDNVTVVTYSYVARETEAETDKLFDAVARNVLRSDYFSNNYAAGDDVEITADDPYAGSSFTGFTVKPHDALSLGSSDLLQQTIKFQMPANNVQVVATYNIDEINLIVPDPTSTGKFSTDVTFDDPECAAAKLCTTTLSYLDADENDIDASSAASADGVYYLYAELDLGDRVGYSFSDNSAATVNGQDASLVYWDERAYVVYKFGETANPDNPGEGDQSSDNGNTADNGNETTQQASAATGSNGGTSKSGSSSTSAVSATGDAAGFAIVMAGLVAALAAAALCLARRKKQR